jgi:hypothetical protein
LILGRLNKDGVIDAYRVSIIPETKAEDEVTTESIVGTISKIDSKKKTFVLTINKTEVNYTLSKNHRQARRPKMATPLRHSKIPRKIFSLALSKFESLVQL